MDGTQAVGVLAPPKVRREKAQSSTFKLAASAAAGFLAGAVFWHLVGFWGFVADALYFRRSEDGVIARQASVAPKAQSRQGGLAGPILQQSGNCSAVVALTAVDTAVMSCDPAVVKFQPSRGVQRADYGDFGPTPVPVLISGQGAAVSGWSARIELPNASREPLASD
jgi:hypothetical protein